jgi:hypothetical protein
MGGKAVGIGEDEATGVALLPRHPILPALTRLLEAEAETQATNRSTPIWMRTALHSAFTLHTVRTRLYTQTALREREREGENNLHQLLGLCHIVVVVTIEYQAQVEMCPIGTFPYHLIGGTLIEYD